MKALVRWRSVAVIWAGAAFAILAADRLGFGSPGIHIEQGLAVFGCLVLAAICWLGDRWLDTYRRAVHLVANVTLAFLLVNCALAIYYEVVDHLPEAPPPVAERYGKLLRQVYPDRTEAEVHELLRFWDRSFVYEPFTQFKMGTYSSRFTNVDQNGFRRSARQGTWPPDPGRRNVFVFGNSTTFSYGLADEETVASQIQASLAEWLGDDVAVYNFGRGLYYSTQERVLFEQFLASGVRPDIAIFIDGLAEFRERDEPSYTPELRKFMAGEVATRPVALLEGWPIQRFADSTSTLLGEAGEQAPGNGPLVPMKQVPDPGASIARYLRNLELLKVMAEAFDVEAMFVWQPGPMFRYDVSYHFAPEEVESHPATKGYPVMARTVSERWPDERFVWCADIQQGLNRPLYVDAIHYGPELSRLLAECISNGLQKLTAPATR